MGSMGGDFDSRFGNSSTHSPHKSLDLEKTQAELRQTFTAAERFRRELEFLQKGGDPLDLTTGSNESSVSVQSTSLTNQHPDEVKGGFAVTGDSSSDNLEIKRRSLRLPAINIPHSDCYSHLDSSQISREIGIELPKKSYKRRFRSQNAGLSSSDVTLSHDASQSPKSINCNGTTEQNLASNEIPSKEGNTSVKKKENNSLDSCHPIHKDEDLEKSGSTWQNELKNHVSEQFVCSQSKIKLVNKEHEDSILKEAEIIEAKRKRVAELNILLIKDTHQNSHWDFVLEEMSWLANDFAQERLWKVTLAAQISRRVSLASKVRYQQKIAQSLSRAVMEFWHAIQVKHKEVKQGLQGYAIRFLEYNSKNIQYSEAQVPMILDMMSDKGIIDISWEENLFYTVPPGATDAYRESIESLLIQCVDDGETRRCYLAAKATTKRRNKNKNNFKFDNGKPYEMEAEDIEEDNESQSQPNRPGSSFNVSSPAKHVRTGSRQRVVGPYNGDMDSFQDDMEAESAGEYEKGSDKPRKKKKPDYQLRNMSNPKKFVELLDKNSKPFKMPGSGTSWSLFEDQSLVVLVHDMGPNWGLISDAINNSFLLFKCIFRSSKECKNRHKMLIVGDSAEDSASSRSYPSTLPGIPEGSARLLFQHLQGPMEEDTLKSHFNKIIIIGRKQYYKRTQNDNQETKQLQPPHISHTHSLSQVTPNNLNGGPVLTPLELCDEIESTPDVPMLPSKDLYMDRGRVTPIDDQHYYQMLSGGKSHGSEFACGPGTARGVRMLPSHGVAFSKFAHGPNSSNKSAFGMRVFKERQRMLQQQKISKMPNAQLPVSSPQKSREIAQYRQKHPLLPPHGVVQTGGTQILKNHKLVNLSQRIVKSSEPPKTKLQGEHVSQSQTSRPAVDQSMVHRQSGWT